MYKWGEEERVMVCVVWCEVQWMRIWELRGGCLLFTSGLINVTGDELNKVSTTNIHLCLYLS